MSDSFGFDLGVPETPSPPREAAPATPYRVLARKYRPQRFSELIGQDAMVQTLGNAIKRDRLAHAFLLTGVRGVGKTSTARLIAKALNCIGPDGQGGPTIDPCGVCEPCVAIAEGRHIDVVEMDAASHTGIDDIREIIEAVRYAAVSARYKVYIIDEVHMLSKAAFNGLLKTLEEPPAHVKFLFATTEVNKVPVTVLSRCQRFDLKRIPADLLARHFAHVAEAEHVAAEPEALALVARAAEGSARDGLSILDQAIAHAGMDGGAVTAAQVRDMLGLSDRGAIRRLFGCLLAADVPGVLAAVAQQDALGVEPAALLRGLLEVVHGVTRAKVGGAEDPALSVEERQAYADWASRLGFVALHRLWQLLLKGHAEVLGAPGPREAVEMALLRVVHASQLPDPGDLAKRLQAGEPLGTAPAPSVSQPEPPPPAPVAALPDTPEAFHALLQQKGALRLAACFEEARVIRFAPPEIVLAESRAIGPGFVQEVLACINPKFGESGLRWEISVAQGLGKASMREQERAQEQAARDAILDAPMVAAVRAAFPDAELIEEPRSAMQ
ncbi:DNA polymerase III subunit gamma/tau [Sphingomonas nostoxanthinifaciens]|uniref:DNA polymerase III subunit gamma/tau n=1 Tax=Sphingomonas nostoxanthinifaciens TaxID=2872652 RepID=UPI001CC20735|nr:DNA polymerase III subunit gamma/tau [Sphingomonas nostoxanthinifaciens]UAK23438.1 DNA polymerase III subunit gamma/tau [Sphingomonas nostoxanthinifaciens]